MKLRVLRKPDANVQPAEPTLAREATYCLNPEFKAPTRQQCKAAVAEEEAKAAGAQEQAKATVADDTALDDEWVWGPHGEHTMHPFWAVRRLTDKQLAREKCLAEERTLRPRFNCTIAWRDMSCGTVGVVKNRAVNFTRLFEVPFLTNEVEVEEGEELILEVAEKVSVERTPTKRTWRQAVQEQERAHGKSKAKSRGPA